MKKATCIYGTVFALFYLHQSSKVNNWEEQIMFCFAYTMIFRILDLKAVSQGMQSPVPYKPGHSLWFEAGHCSQCKPSASALGVFPCVAYKPYHGAGFEIE